MPETKTEDYKYSELNSFKPGNDKVNFYAVILDAQFPHKSFRSEKYVCALKIADQSCKIDKEDGTIDFCTLVLFANKFEDLPISQRVGDIIRIHRAQVCLYKEQKQFTANIFFNSSWALFGPTAGTGSVSDQFKPLMFFGKQLRFANPEFKLIKTLRLWIAASFKTYRMLSTQFITELQ